MLSFSKFAILLITAALFGASLTPNAAFAQAVTAKQAIPGPLPCGKPSLLLSITHGLVDNFSTTGPPDPPPTPSNFLLAAPYAVGTPSNQFDYSGKNYHFGDSFTIAVPPNSTVVSARLTTRLRPDDATGASAASNDAIVFHATGTLPASSLTYQLSNICANCSGQWGTPNPAEIFVFNFPNSFVTDLASAIATAPSQPQLDVYVEDDTSVDFLRLEVCYIPPAGPDVAATKVHKGSTYSLNVSNPGGPIQMGDIIEVTDYVPNGLTVTAINPNGWTCAASPPASPNVIGPAVITCTFPVTTPIATSASLPPIQLATTGKPTCQNCMRVRLLLKGGQAQETNTANNVSCVN